MKSYFYKNLLFILILMLSGCVTGPAVKQVDRIALQQQLLTLPGAEVDLETLTVSYPGEVLFATGSVLPFPGGMEVLSPLASWILQTDAIYAEGSVRSSGHTIDYDRTLAEKRLELLQALFKNRGVTPDRLKLSVDGSAGAALEIHLRFRTSEISSGKKS
jgi:hypothetical protein